MSSWLCPYCNQMSTEGSYIDRNCSFNMMNSIVDGVTQPTTIKAMLYSRYCPNPECLKFTVNFAMDELEPAHAGWRIKKRIVDNRVLPIGATKIFPDYVPDAILNDYKEACLIRELSPKSSATLARRCLQGMIRDVWGVSEKNLALEIKAIEDKVESEMWEAIDSIRSIGNIGAHMEKDINIIVDVEPSEAQLLIELLEMLIQEWYVERHNKKLRLASIKSLAEKKQEERKKQ
ncbi:DUF4145 domain-containing protein [Providencia stuartii]|uniref:DUF4145 domain-containing protein n=1 Tax=Providencia stuartii TaxID=588 RepID=UPI00201D4E06|nr:DUF4145 domain-containing protein [Providencia stuartii]UQZ10702.1 DUF4145 domain-containing protein [Providencia stuartii]